MFYINALRNSTVFCTHKQLGKSFHERRALVFIVRTSFIHSLKLYKIADKTLLSNVSTTESNIACLMQ